MKEEFVNELMEKYSFFYRDPEKKVYKKYPKQAISEEVGDEWYGAICKLCEELYWYFKEIECPVQFMFIEIRIRDQHLQIYYLLTGGTSEVSNWIDEIIEKYEEIQGRVWKENETTKQLDLRHILHAEAIKVEN